MEQPPTFIAQRRVQGKCLHLKKSFYDLKEPPRPQFGQFSGVLIEFELNGYEAPLTFVSSTIVSGAFLFPSQLLSQKNFISYSLEFFSWIPKSISKGYLQGNWSMNSLSNISVTNKKPVLRPPPYCILSFDCLLLHIIGESKI